MGKTCVQWKFSPNKSKFRHISKSGGPTKKDTNTIRFFYILMTTGYFNTKVVRNLHEFSHLWEAQNIRKNNTHKSNHIK